MKNLLLIGGGGIIHGSNPVLHYKSIYIMLKFRCFNTMVLRQNGHYLADDTFKCIFVDENVRISIKISLTFAPKGLINNISAQVLIMAFIQPTSHYLNQWWLEHRHIYASLGLGELKHVHKFQHTLSRGVVKKQEYDILYHFEMMKIVAIFSGSSSTYLTL